VISIYARHMWIDYQFPEKIENEQTETTQKPRIIMQSCGSHSARIPTSSKY
jgi:hypothetical protein